MPEVPIELRPIEPNDYHFILSSWMQSFRPYVCRPKPGEENKVVALRSIHAERYFPAQQRLIAALSKRRNLVVACDPENKDYVMGWICGAPTKFTVGTAVQEEMIVDYVYVKHAYRTQGIAKILLERGLGWHGEPIVATHWTSHVARRANAYKIQYDDYLLKLGVDDV